LLVVGGLALVLMSLAAFSQRHLLSGLQLSDTHTRTAKAFEAAQAGIDWALVRLNHRGAVDAHCRPSSSPEAPSFADRLLQPRSTSPVGGAPPLPRAGARCVASAEPWPCECGPPGRTVDTPPATRQGAEPAHFNVQLLSSAHGNPDRLQLVSYGCQGSTPPCHDDNAASSNSNREAVSRLQVTLARMPALAQAPVAALTVRGALTLGGSPWRIDNEQGLAVHTGGAVSATALTARGAPGSPASSAQWHDASLGQQPADVAFASMLRVPRATWPQLPSVRRVACRSACDSALREAMAPDAVATLLWLDGGLHVDRPLTLGTPARPVVLVSDGPVVLRASLVVHGMVYALSPDWSAVAGSVVHGAVVAEGSLRGQGVQQVRYDSAVLSRLQTEDGTWLRVAGSWKDF
jgi:hypothetical protein